MKRNILKLCFTLICFSSIHVFPQENLGKLVNVEQTKDNTWVFTTEEGLVSLQFCTQNIVRMQISWENPIINETSLMVVKEDWPKVEVRENQLDNRLQFRTDDLVVEVLPHPFKLNIYDAKGTLLSSEMEVKDAGAHTKEYAVGVKKQLFPDEHFFGFGERMDVLDRRGTKTRLNVGRGQGRPHIVGAYNVLEANYSPIPFFMSTRGYGIFFTTAYPTVWDMGHSSKEWYSFTAEGGALDYYFIHGPTFSRILDGYTEITGKSPLLPKFAHGLHVGTYSGGTWGHEEKTSDDYVVALARKFRTMEIPVDVLHLDSTWRIFGENGGKGATSFEWRETFKDPKAMFDSIYALNFNMVGLHLRPRFDNGKKLRLLDEARAGGFVYPEENGLGEFVNFFNQKSVDWWWENGVKTVADQGAMFLKTDEGSAFGHKANESHKTGPQGEEVVPLHNLFPLAYAKAPFEKFSEYNNMRGLNLTREGYAGIQRYPYIFAGDWPSEWQYFKPVILAGLNIGLSGVGYWSHCMGGFEHVADPELYMRWVQFGMFSPIAHLFGMEHPNYKEPWSYGDEALANFKKYDELRYRLLPYIYSTAYQQYKTGKPIMCALVLENQNDENTFGIHDQYMFGDFLMVCPVTTKGAQTRVVYLPKGNWVDFWSGRTFQGGKRINVLSPKDVLPIFVKSGAIIPMQEPVQFIDNNEVENIHLHIYPGGNAAHNLYDDDGLSNSYATNTMFVETQIETNDNGERLKINISTPKGNFKLTSRNYILHIPLEKIPTEIYLNDNKVERLQAKTTEKMGYRYEDGVLWLILTKATEKRQQLTIIKSKS